MTNEEIVKALRCHCDAIETGACPKDKCPAFERPARYKCAGVVSGEAADLIEQLIDENTELREEVNLRGNAIRTYEKKRAEAEAERDAAVLNLRIFAGCVACKHCCNHRRYHQGSLLFTCCDCAKKQNCKCGSCSLGRSNWEWLGLPEQPEERGKA